jgi:hypothetical protein
MVSFKGGDVGEPGVENCSRYIIVYKAPEAPQTLQSHVLSVKPFLYVGINIIAPVEQFNVLLSFEGALLMQISHS